MPTKPRSRLDPSGRPRGCVQLDRHIPAYHQYLADRGNAAGYARSCEAAVAHLSMWLKGAKKSLADVDEGLVAEFVDRHLPECHCATSARHPSSVRAALGHLLVVLRAAGAIEPKPLDLTEVGQELRRYDQYMEQVRWARPEDARRRAASRRSAAAPALRRRRHPVRGHHTGACTPLLRCPGQELQGTDELEHRGLGPAGLLPLAGDAG